MQTYTHTRSHTHTHTPPHTHSSRMSTETWLSCRAFSYGFVVGGDMHPKLKLSLLFLFLPLLLLLPLPLLLKASKN